MISQKTIKKYEFNNLDDYYAYIIDSKINGNFSQVKDLIKKLSKGQKEDFINYLNNYQIDLNDYVGFLI